MKKILSLSVLLVLMFTIVQAQAPKGMGKSDPDAKKILDAVSAKFKSFKSVQSNFTLKIENAANKLIDSKKGTVYMKGTKYRIKVAGQDIFCDGSNVWTVDPASKEITLTKLDPQTIPSHHKNYSPTIKIFLYKLNSDAKKVQK
ncbi:MAG: outer membrane lipoprotein carrier protein LolA [Ferruginibacter sp.]